jgi:undecaprenyl phosphate N,N'-diacetylbacillosamine 1-phosphate transferase
MYRNNFKRLFDLILASSLFLLFSPFFIIITSFLYISNNGKPFFVQKRPGLNEKIFEIIKFKTMNDKKDENGNFLPDKDRLTKIGIFVRKSSLDEIPQLLNILKGDMSLIGPRPLLIEYLSLYNEQQKKRHHVKPGITGWAQVNGRNAISWQQKFDLDIWYVENFSFVLDLKIIFKTILNIFLSKDINQNGKATVDYFKGNF